MPIGNRFSILLLSVNFLLPFSYRRILANPHQVTILIMPGLSYTLDAFFGE